MRCGVCHAHTITVRTYSAVTKILSVTSRNPSGTPAGRL
ncbi:hypothetical protein Pd630_LPD02232 [Rhodococcus opacus PD630]|nr:hypothetical protein Pd630_LPD02232 [Rhodococcus opacus PD630]